MAVFIFDGVVSQPAVRFAREPTSAFTCLRLLAFENNIDPQISFVCFSSKGNLSHRGKVKQLVEKKSKYVKSITFIKAESSVFDPVPAIQIRP